MTVTENIAKLAQLVDTVKAHHMCAKFTETYGFYLVYFPPGYSLDGCRVSKGMGKAKALETMITKMEECWKSTQL